MIRRSEFLAPEAGQRKEQALWQRLLASVAQSRGLLGETECYEEERPGSSAYALKLGGELYCGGETEDFAQWGSFLRLRGLQVLCPRAWGLGLQASLGRGEALFLAPYGGQKSGPASGFRLAEGIGDFRKIYELYRACGLKLPAFDEYYVNLFHRVQRGESAYFLAEEEGGAAAAVGRRGAVICGLAVHPAHRRRGRGTAGLAQGAAAVGASGEMPLVLFKEEARSFYAGAALEEEEALWLFD